MKDCQGKIEKHLLKGGTISQLSALTMKFDYCGRLSETIRRLRLKHGAKKIITEMYSSPLTKSKYAIYSMKK